MTPDEFKAWRNAMGYSQAEAAKALDLSKGTIENYERGHRLDDGRAVKIPRTVALATQALAGVGHENETERPRMHASLYFKGKEAVGAYWRWNSDHDLTTKLEEIIADFRDEYPEVHLADCEIRIRGSKGPLKA